MVSLKIDAVRDGKKVIRILNGDTDVFVILMFWVLKGALYRIWCGVNRLGDSGVKVV